MSSPAMKILVTGDVEGKFTQLFKRVEAVNSKNGPFEMLLCLGDFFGSENDDWKMYLNGNLKAPISTYVLGPNSLDAVKYYPDNKGCELCHNITYLGQKGVLTTANGLKLVYLSGHETHREKSDDLHFTKEDIKTILLPLINQSQFKGIDLLLTSQWPQGITKYATEPNGYTKDVGSKLIAQLAQALRPRYHFSASEGIHYERLPYRNHKVLMEQPKHISRFIALAKIGNPEKQKWLYAFNIVPLANMDAAELTKQPQDVTECPYQLDEEIKLTQAQEDSGKNTQYFYDMSEPKQRKRTSNEMPDKQTKKKQVYRPSFTGPCWFCLGSPEVEKHLVVSIGTNIYLTLAKGPLVPDHVLILPIGHFQSTVELPTDGLEEIEEYKAALRKLYKSKKKAPVFFERNYKTQHLQIQVVPIPLTVTSESIVTNFLDIADSLSIQLDEIPKHSELAQILSPGCPYFYVELPSGQKFLHRIRGKFPLQFGREVLACPALLNVPERCDWKSCKSSAEEEAAMAKAFKSAFEPFDFTV